MTFHIDIQKKLPGFQLQAQLSSEREIVGILGASGSGKSMLLRCIAGLVKPDSGKIIVHGKTFFDSEKKINLPPRERKVGFLFQNYALFPHLTLAENIVFGLTDLTENQKKNKADELMDKFHLKDLGGRYPSQISGGQQQRVALARAMAVQPEILLLDEPFSALDNHLRNHMMKEMQGFLKDFQGSTLYVTHNMEEAYRLCNHIAILNTGKVDVFDQKQSLFNFPSSLEAARITGCKNISQAVKRSDYEVEIPDWSISVKTHMKIAAQNGYIGIRANHLKLASREGDENSFPVWIADKSETPFRTSLYLKLGSAPGNADDYHLQWEVSRAQAAELMVLEQPFHIVMDPEHVFFIKQPDKIRPEGK